MPADSAEGGVPLRNRKMINGTAMNFAQNQQQAELVSDIQNWISVFRPGPTSEKWLLFDGAVLGAKIMRKLIRMFPATSCHNVFAGTAFERYELLSPHLVQISDVAVVAKRVPTILELMDGVPAISLLDANADGQVLRRCLSWLGHAKTEDGMELYCRFADTRVTSSLLRTLAEDQRTTLKQSIHEWRIVDRRGRLDTLLTSDVTELAMETGAVNLNPAEHLCLNDEQFTAMMKAAEADEIFQMLCEGASDLVPTVGCGDFYLRLSKLVAAARRYGLDRCQDIYQFCVVGLTTADEFYLAPELCECWARILARLDDFGSVVASWPDETWAAIAYAGIQSSEFPVRGERHESV